MKKYFLIPSAALVVLASGSIFAATLQDNINVTAVVTAACSSLTANDIDFGSAGAADVTDDHTASILVTCNTGTAYTVELDYGVNAVNITQRQVGDTNNGEFMDYEIFQPADATGAAGTTSPWGTESLDTGSSYANTGTGAAQALTATGRLTRLGATSPGTYTDLVVVTLTF